MLVSVLGSLARESAAVTIYLLGWWKGVSCLTRTVEDGVQAVNLTRRNGKTYGKTKYRKCEMEVPSFEGLSSYNRTVHWCIARLEEGEISFKCSLDITLFEPDKISLV